MPGTPRPGSARVVHDAQGEDDANLAQRPSQHPSSVATRRRDPNRGFRARSTTGGAFRPGLEQRRENERIGDPERVVHEAHGFALHQLLKRMVRLQEPSPASAASVRSVPSTRAPSGPGIVSRTSARASARMPSSPSRLASRCSRARVRVASARVMRSAISGRSRHISLKSPASSSRSSAWRVTVARLRLAPPTRTACSPKNSPGPSLDTGSVPAAPRRESSTSPERMK